MKTPKCYRSIALSLAAGLIATGCSQFIPVSPYFREAPEVVLARAQDESNASGATEASDWPEQEWWDLFCDPQLSALIHRALADHPTMKVAEARVDLAVAAFRRERAPLFPSINAEGDYTRWRNSKNGIFGLAPMFPLTYTQPEASINFTYEFDFWRKHANLIAAAVDEVHAREAEAHQSGLLLSLSVAEAYFEQQITHAREELALQAVENRKKSAELSALRKKNGLDDRLTFNVAKIGIQATLQYAEIIADQVAKSGYALQALIGGDFDVEILNAAPDGWVCKPMPLPESLPLELLAHRADVWAYRWRAEAAAKEICVARAGFYPNVNLLGYAGLQSIEPSKFFETQSFYGTIGPAFQLPIFQGGALRANLAASHFNQALTIAEYENAVLEAVKEALTAIAHLESTEKRYASVLASERAAADSLKRAREILKNNVGSKMEVLLYEYEWLQARDTTLQTFLELLKSRLGLIRAMGGGTEPACG